MTAEPRRSARRAERSAPAAGAGHDLPTLGLAVATVLAVVVPVLWGGGFRAPAQAAFVVLAGAALLATIAVDGARAAAAIRHPLIIALAALGILELISAAWTIAGSAVAVRTGLVVVGYGAVAVAGYVATARGGAGLIAGVVAVAAVLEALLGLGAVALHALPDAERLGRVWRPGGTFEYQPALALLGVGALPVLVSWVRRAVPALTFAGGTGAFVIGGAIELAGDRLAFGLTAVVLLGLLTRLRPSRVGRWSVGGIAVLGLAGALVTAGLLGAAVGPLAPAPGAARLAEVLGLAVLAGLIASVSVGLRARPIVGRTAAGLGAVLVVAAVLLAHPGPGGHGASRAIRPLPVRVTGATSASGSTDFFHGRTHEWQAALQTWMDRPVLGAGAGSYSIASLPHQTIARSLFPHDLPLELSAELGILGFLLALGVYGGAARAIWRALRHRDGWLIAPFVACFLVSNLVDWTWHLTGLTALWAVAGGALIALSQRAARST